MFQGTPPKILRRIQWCNKNFWFADIEIMPIFWQMKVRGRIEMKAQLLIKMSKAIKNNPKSELNRYVI